MEIAQGYARRPKRIYAVENCGFLHFVIKSGYPFCTNLLQTILMKKVHIFSYFVVLCWFLKYVSHYKALILLNLPFGYLASCVSTLIIEIV